jgi:ornithine carbamoyltransferase
LACPEGYDPEPEIWERAQEEAANSGANLEIVHDMQEAVKDADIVNVYCWASPDVFKAKFKRRKGKLPISSNRKNINHGSSTMI